jgi:membrane protein insertase Oxa1/YidC/SpoIIIJ
MPFIFVPISFGLPAGVVIYFVVSNMVRIGQQALVTRLEFPEKGKDDGNGAKPKAPTPAPAPAVAAKTPPTSTPNRAKSRKKKRK